jgi:hypothetical protein
MDKSVVNGNPGPEFPWNKWFGEIISSPTANSAIIFLTYHGFEMRCQKVWASAA